MIGKIFCRSFVKSIAIVACVASWSLNAQTLSPKDSVLMQKALVSPNKTFPVILRFSSEASRTKVMPALQLGTQSKSARSSDSAMQVNRLYKHLPLASMRVSASELANLLQDPDVEVYEDSIKFPSLANSVPAVYPTQATSQFHGNNQWTVAVLDTGIERTHSFLASKVVSQACYSDGGGQPGSTEMPI